MNKDEPPNEENINKNKIKIVSIKKPKRETSNPKPMRPKVEIISTERLEFSCPDCHEVIERDYKICPKCGYEIQK